MYILVIFGFFLLDISIQLLQLVGAIVIVIGVSISLQTKSK